MTSNTRPIAVAPPPSRRGRLPRSGWHERKKLWRGCADALGSTKSKRPTLQGTAEATIHDQRLPSDRPPFAPGRRNRPATRGPTLCSVFQSVTEARAHPARLAKGVSLAQELSVVAPLFCFLFFSTLSSDLHTFFLPRRHSRRVRRRNKDVRSVEG